MALLLPSGASLPTPNARPPRGWTYGLSQGRPTLRVLPTQEWSRAVHQTRLQRTQFLSGLAAYWTAGAGLTPAIYSAFGSFYSPWLTWQQTSITLTPYLAFLAMNLLSFGDFLSGSYNPATDTPFSESWTVTNSARETWSNPRIITLGPFHFFALDNPSATLSRTYLGTFYSPIPGRRIVPGTPNPALFTSSSDTNGTVNPVHTVIWNMAGAYAFNPFGQPSTPTTIALRPNNGTYPDPAHPPNVLDSPQLDKLFFATFP